ncbi:MAG: hypothetical protein KGL39_41590 [Patescibacteria group bacterium]|nr:hypothetical protein [Patescibacteria group bacterium]
MKFIYLNKPDKSDPLNEKRVLCVKHGRRYLMISWHWAPWENWRYMLSWPRFEFGRIE